MSTRICVTIKETSTAQAVLAAKLASPWADLVEFRADYIHDLSIRALLEQKPCPTLFTLRGRQEGGEYAGSDSDRYEAWAEAVRCGADYVDVEFSAVRKELPPGVPSQRAVLSHHNFEGTPLSLESLAREMAATGAEVLKIATTARALTDNLIIFQLLEFAKRESLNICALAMGCKGIPSRILGPLRGSWMTFASLPGGEPTAEGQIPADLLVERYRARQLGPEPKLYGVVGKPLAHSLSPHIHNAVFAARGNDALFLPLEASSFEDFLNLQASLQLEGASVTIPYKGDAFASVESRSPSASETGAVNTLVRREGGWHGDNTDVDGFIDPLKRRVQLRNLRALVLGAGGAARAVICGLRREGAAVTISARSPVKARDLAGAFGVGFCEWEKLAPLQWDLLVNATPVGMHPNLDATPMPADHLTGPWVYDLIYNPVETRLLREAGRQGCRTIAGAEMFLGQARAQQNLWDPSPIPPNVMERAVSEALGWVAPPEFRGTGS
jgi:3-dehydroquinate dehydratase/shikimate dehydrogenase